MHALPRSPRPCPLGGGAKDVRREPRGLVAVVDGVGADTGLRAFAQAEFVGEQRGQDGGVDAAGEQRTERDVRFQPAAGGRADQVADPLDGRVAVVGVETRFQLPVAAFADAVPVEDEYAAGFDLTDARPHGRPGVEQQAVGLSQAVGVHAGPDLRMGEERLGLGGEGETAVDGCPVERLDAEPVAHQQQPLGALVPDGEGEHAVQVSGDVLTPFGTGAQDHLGVAAGTEAVSQVRQSGPEFVVVVDLAAVAEDEVGFVRSVGHRLDTAGRVDDGQPAMTDGGAFAEPDAAGVGAARSEGGGHGFDGRCLGAGVVVEGRPAGDSAHSGGSWVSGGRWRSARDAARDVCRTGRAEVRRDRRRWRPGPAPLVPRRSEPRRWWPGPGRG